MNDELAHKIFKRELRIHLDELSDELDPATARVAKIIKGFVGACAVGIALFAVSAYANPPILIDPHTGKYLGNLSANKYDPNSTSNSYGRYGSKYSPDSINNPYSKYGSQYSNDSANNPYATNAPAIVVPNCYGC